MAFRSTRILYMVGIKENQFILMTSDFTRFANYTGLSLRIKYPFDMIHGVSRNRIKDTAVSLQEEIQSGFIVSNFILLTLDEFTVALIYNQTCDTHSPFDSHSKNVTGNPTSEEAAVLLTYDCIEDLT